MSETSEQSFSYRLFLLLANVREMGIVLVILILIPLIGLRNPSFLTASNFRDILLDISILSIVAIGQMMVILTASIDLSVGSVVGLVAMVIGLLVRDNPGIPMVVTVLLGTLLGLVLGSINGIIVTKGRVPPIITTLGTLSIYRGLVLVVSKGEWIDAYRLPPSFPRITRIPIFGVPALIIYALIIAVVAYYFLRFTRTGRQIYAVGSNPPAARLAGIRANRIVLLVFLISGTLAGLGGVLWASRFAAVANDTGTGFELQTVAACVIGGVAIFGGSGSVPGVLLGSLLLGIIVNALTLTGISPFWRLTVQGLIILVAVVADALIARRLQEVQARRTV
jgi:rhamnose transport system permease protein